MEAINRQTAANRRRSYKRHPGALVLRVLVSASAVLTAGVLLALVGYIVIRGIPNLRPGLFAAKYNSTNVSMLPALINTVIFTVRVLVLAVPFGVGAAIYLTEYAHRGSRLVKLVRVTTETLAGIPSIVYGLFGYLMFNITLGMGYSLLSGVLTLSIMVLPTMMRTTEEALLAVPDSFREGSFGLGAGRLRTVFRIVLPSAVPGILSGVILSVGRVVGETAALIFTSGTGTGIAAHLSDSGRTLAVHMYMLLNEGLHMEESYAVALVLLVLVIGINALSDWTARKMTAK